MFTKRHTRQRLVVAGPTVAGYRYFDGMVDVVNCDEGTVNTFGFAMGYQ